MSAGTPTTGILRVGARGAQGLTSLQVAMCARIALVEPSSAPWLDKRGSNIGVIRSLALPADLYGVERLVRLGAPALAEAARGIDGKIALFLALPEGGRPDDAPGFAENVLAGIAAEAKVDIDRAASRAFRAGSAGFAFALEAASARASAGHPALVGGVDSYYHPDVLRWLDEECRLHSEKAEDGFLPSEGAAFASVAAPQRKSTPSPIAWLRAVATGREATALGDEPNLAEAMTTLVHGVFMEGGFDWVITDVNGEEHRVSEWMKVAGRANAAMGEAHFQHLPSLLGDVGAATGALALAIAASWWGAGCAPSPRALVALHCEGAERGVFVLEEGR